MGEILHQAEQSEKDYDWLAAADSYERALNLLPQDDFSRMGETCERLGHAFCRAAMQAESQEKFRERMQRAIDRSIGEIVAEIDPIKFRPYSFIKGDWIL